MKRNLFKSRNLAKPLDPKLLGQLLVLFLAVVGTLIPDLALAGTDPRATTGTELQGAWDIVSGIIGGFGGKLISGVSFLCALIGSVWGFNPRLIVGAGAVGITTALAPAFINATVGALI